jgi:hypothetical protein
MLLFNVDHQDAYTSASATGFLRAHKIIVGKFLYGGEPDQTTDMYIVHRS